MADCQIKPLATSRLSDICIETRLTMQLKEGELFTRVQFLTFVLYFIQLLDEKPPPFFPCDAQGTPQALSREQKELPEIHWCQNEWIFEGFSGCQKRLNFWISVFFWISGLILRKKSYRRSVGVKTTGFFRACLIF